MNFISFYESLDRNSVKVFCQKDGYFIYEDDIERLIVSGLSLPATNISEEKLRSVKLTKPEYENVIKFSLVNLKIPVVEFISSIDGYKITKTGTPSNWNDFYEICLNESIIPSFASIYLKKEEKNKIYLVILSENVYKQTEFYDDDIFSHLFCILTGFNVTECVINDDKLERPLKSMGLVVKICKIKNKEEENESKRTFSLPLIHKEKEEKVICGNLALKLMKKYACTEDITAIELNNPLSFTIDNFTLSVINPLKYFNCLTAQGKRLLEQFVRTPLLNKEEIFKRQNLTKSFSNLELSQLKNITDFLKITKQLENKKCTIENFIKLEENLTKIQNLILEIKETLEIKENTLLLLQNVSAFRNEINRLISKEGFINEINDTLKDLHSELRKVNKEIKKEREKILSKNKKIKISECNFKISRNDYKIFEEEFKKNRFLEISFLKSGVVFTTKEMDRLNKETEKLEILIKNEEKIIVSALNDYGYNFTGIIEAINYMVSQIDVYKAFAEKITEGWTYPSLEDSFLLKHAFHPQIKIGNIPNSIEITEKRFVTITGPNMGGKSTFLKTVGMIALLSQIGAPVPALSAKIPLFDSILVRIGANDCPSRHKSTFLNEMEEISKITHRCTENSLVLIDELGRGTSDIDGLSIAMAVKEYLIKKGSFVFFATHFTEVCTEECVNKKIEVLNNKIFYKLIDGIGDSYGIGVAKMVNFPEEVIEEAKKYL